MKLLKQQLVFIASLYLFSTNLFALGGTTHVAANASAARGEVSKVQQSADQTPQGAPGTTPPPKTLPPEPTVMYGITIPAVIVADNPPQTHLYSAIVWYHPQSWSWRDDHVNLYIAGSFGHWWSKGAEAYPSINIYALVPVVRFYPFKSNYFSPYLEASVGPAYMNQTQFANRNLGMHYTFQDQAAIGFVIGRNTGFYASLSVLHYSNGALSAHNSGITVPVMLNMGWQFN